MTNDNTISNTVLIRKEMQKLRNASEQTLCLYNEETKHNRISWYRNSYRIIDQENEKPIERAYKLFLKKLDISTEEAPIAIQSDKRIVFHSKNFCPTLEACKLLGLDTRKICKLMNEDATDAFLKEINPNLKFSRNYEKLRPYSEYCEEIIEYIKE